MHFILEGRVGIIVNMDDGRSIRVRSLGPHTTIGEMGLITSQLRSATIQAEVPSVLYALSADAYERIKRENEPLAQALLTYVISIMVGDLQRIREYPARGFQIPQNIPDDVWDAYNELVRAGYDRHLMTR